MMDRGLCTGCNAEVAVNLNGKVRMHKTFYGGYYCPGSDKLPVPGSFLRAQDKITQETLAHARKIIAHEIRSLVIPTGMIDRKGAWSDVANFIERKGSWEGYEG